MTDENAWSLDRFRGNAGPTPYFTSSIMLSLSEFPCRWRPSCYNFLSFQGWYLSNVLGASRIGETTQEDVDSAAWSAEATRKEGPGAEIDSGIDAAMRTTFEKLFARYDLGNQP